MSLGSPAELISLARAGKRLQPLFIIGEGRSGTTLLFRLLQQQPAFGPHPPQLAESDFMTVLLAARDIEADTAWKVRNYMLDDADGWRRFRAAAWPLLAVRAVVRPLRPGAYAHPRIGALLGARALVRIYLAVAADVRGVTRLIEKTPYHTLYAPHLLRWFPGARLVYLHRHPVDVLSSFWRRAGVDRRMAGWADLTVEAFAHRYAERSSTALAWAERRPDAVRLVRYENLVKDPAAEISALCTFAGVGFDPGAIEAAEEGTPTPDPLTWKPVTEKSKEWRDYMSEEEAADLEDRLEPVLDRLGHVRYTDAGRTASQRTTPPIST